MVRRTLLSALLVWAPACFNEAGSLCPAGSESCPCVELQCEAGLVCQDAMCVQSATGSAGSVGSAGSQAEAGTTLPMPGSTSGVSTTSAPSTDSGLDSSTGAVGPTTEGGGEESSSGGQRLCGNDTVNPTEECDGTPGCSAQCELDNHECNPLNNVPCPRGQKCSVTPDEIAVCMPFLTEPPGLLHAGNCFSNFNPQDAWCDVGLACALGSQTDACDTNCCVEFCELNTGFDCAFAGEVCRQFFSAEAPVGLAHIGFCGTP